MADIEVNCQFITVKVSANRDPRKAIPLRLVRARGKPNLWATADGKRVFNSEEWALKSMEMDTPAYKERSSKRMEASRLVNAVVVENYDGWVTTTGDEDDYAEDVPSLLEKHADAWAWAQSNPPEGETAHIPPAWAFCCTEDGFDFDIEDAIRTYVSDNHHEDAVEWIKDWKGLDEFWSAWVAKQKDLRSYFIDTKRIVVIDRKRYEAELAAAKAYLEASENG